MRKWVIGILAAALGVAPAIAWAAPDPVEDGPPPAGTYIVHAIDVGTGLAVFVEGHDFTLLYDAGSNDDTARGAANRVVAYIHAVRRDLRSIDHVVLSHPHQDHSELMPDVLTQFQVRNLWNSGALNPICSYRQLLVNAAATHVAYHDALGGPGTYDGAFKTQKCYGKTLPAATISVPRSSQMSAMAVPLGAGAQMTILQRDGSHKSSFNENSVVVRLELGTRSLLLPGDAEAGGRKAPSTIPSTSSSEGKLLACCAAQLRSDILVAPHHGSMTSSRSKYIAAVHASEYLVSAGPTKYSTVVLPDQDVIDEYTGLVTAQHVWRTDVTDATTCPTNPAKIGPDNDGRAGGCDNVRIVIGPTGTITAGYYHPAD
ncbi:MAG: competence protein ComEC [Sphingomonadales bacterium]|nr:competence protein ComEC [Sphingomonadales bacterium]